MNRAQFVVRGIPVPQPRPRTQTIVRAGRKPVAHTWTPDSAAEWKAAVVRAARPHLPPDHWEGPIAVTIRVFFPRPKWLEAAAAAWYTGARGDCDNVAKAILDALNPSPAVKDRYSGRVVVPPGPAFWLDDRQVVRLQVELMHAAKGCSPGARITVERLTEAPIVLFGADG